MKKLLGLIFHPWLLLALGVLALSLVIWWVGPLLALGAGSRLWHPLEPEWARWSLIGGIVGLFVLRKLWQAWQARRTNRKVIDKLVAPAERAAAPANPEVAALTERFTKALATLKTARFDAGAGAGGVGAAWNSVSARIGKRYLYELPWYVIIGAPGSGKTTALINSGLKFPLASAVGERSVPNVGGTRNCDWWFTDEAVLIDTAGRYTTQDSDRGADAAAWEGFLGLLKKSRPRQPLNGVLVTVSVNDLLLQGPAERAQHAATVRQRVQELHQSLRMRFPIYLLVTKCDLLAGFIDTLGEIDKEQRATPWGFTFRMDRQQHSDLAAFETEFDALQQRLTDGLIDRLQLERDPQRRARIYGFPQQFDGLRAVLKDFVDQVFSPSQFEAHPLLRGVYFVSGTQEGTPIDRMLGRIARTYRLERTVLPPHEGAGKSFFLQRLLREVVFAEAALAGTDLGWERRRARLAAAGYAALAVVTGVALGAWGLSYVNNRDYVATVDHSVDEVRQLVQSTPNRASPDLVVLLPALEATRDLARAGAGATAPWSHGFGLYQGRKLDDASQQAYRRMLTDAVLPRLALRVEEQLRTGTDNPELQYEALKAYVMLYDTERFDPQALRQYVLADWQLNLPREVTTTQRDALATHLDALLDAGAAVSPLPEDRALVVQTRARIAATPLEERIYRRLKLQGVGADIPAFTIARAGGPSTPLAFRRASGKPLTEGMPGLYTYDGYHKGFQSEVEKLSTQMADEERWVLGITDESRLAALRDPLERNKVADRVRRLYLTEYADRWEEFIADIKMLQTGNLTQAMQMARVLSAPDNPLVPLMTALSHQTTLGDSSDLTSKLESSVRSAAQQAQDKLVALMGNKGAAVTSAAPGRIENIVDDRFVALRQLVTPPGGGGGAGGGGGGGGAAGGGGGGGGSGGGGGGGGQAPIATTVALINDVYTQLSAADTAVKGGNTPPPSDVPNKVKAEAPRMPEPVRSLLATLSVIGTETADRQEMERLNQLLATQIGDFCRQAVTGRYPFVRGSQRDVPQEDFSRLFAPGGLFDAFFQQNLLSRVNTGTRPWSFKAVGTGAAPASAGGLQQFQHAAAIRDVFFRAGGNVPGVRLDFKPVEMDTTITQFILDVDGQLVKYAHGPQIPASVQWPGPRGSTQVRVSLSPTTANGLSGMSTEGPWALFKLFERVQLEPGNAPEKFRATFNIEGRKAVFDVTTSSVRNPFRIPELEQFSCPGRL